MEGARPSGGRLPLVPTLLVALAVATMVALGIWQWARAGEKAALKARYAEALGQPPIAWPSGALAEKDRPLYRRATALCLQPVTHRAIAGRNREGTSGHVHWIDCRTGAEGPGLRVEIGWSPGPTLPQRWSGGEVSGVIAPDRELGMRLIANDGLAGLQPSARPDPADLPDNHRMYAFQWFAFAAIALVIYLLALRRRRAEGSAT